MAGADSRHTATDALFGGRSFFLDAGVSGTWLGNTPLPAWFDDDNHLTFSPAVLIADGFRPFDQGSGLPALSAIGGRASGALDAPILGPSVLGGGSVGASGFPAASAPASGMLWGSTTTTTQAAPGQFGALTTDAIARPSGSTLSASSLPFRGRAKSSGTAAAIGAGALAADVAPIGAPARAAEAGSRIPAFAQPLAPQATAERGFLAANRGDTIAPMAFGSVATAGVVANAGAAGSGVNGPDATAPRLAPGFPRGQAAAQRSRPVARAPGASRATRVAAGPASGTQARPAVATGRGRGRGRAVHPPSRLPRRQPRGAPAPRRTSAPGAVASSSSSSSGAGSGTPPAQVLAVRRAPGAARGKQTAAAGANPTSRANANAKANANANANAHGHGQRGVRIVHGPRAGVGQRPAGSRKAAPAPRGQPHAAGKQGQRTREAAVRGSNTRAAPHSRGQTTAGQPRRPAATSKAAARSTAGAPAKEQASSKAPAATATAAARAAKSTSHRRSTPSPASAATSVATAGGAAQPPRDNASRRSQTPPSDAKGGARPSSKQAEVNKDAALPKPMPKKRGGLASNGSQTKPGAPAVAAPATAAANATGVRSRSRSRSRSGSKGSKGSTGSSESTHKAPKARALTAVPPARAQPAAASKPPRPRSKSSRIAESALPTGGRAGGGKSGTSKGKAGGSSSRRGKNGRSNSSSMSKPGASDGAATRKPSHRGEGVKVKKPRKAVSGRLILISHARTWCELLTLATAHVRYSPRSRRLVQSFGRLCGRLR